ncbi:hypothetical protein [Phyllobacterium sp. P30BS-XVII]|uniref:hypothetical protein n=1 Tax=Phyllobacterium sp. P30BS-XVII TaxID=2587046 RepID=UPI0015FA428E|nr:hypothetical protein [Phyllobacterium sp. P30BS-XVII]MBA8904115.1 hypothetical protein [Phyllobacterium sp. P30BS-XVII]
MLTLDEFRATRQYIKDLAPYFGIASEDGTERPGYTYAEDCYLIICGQGRRPYYYLGIGPNEWTSPDLARQEERLYQNWYMLEHQGEGDQS